MRDLWQARTKGWYAWRGVRRTRGRKPWPHTHRQHRLEDSMIKRIIDFLTLRWLWGRSRGRRRRREQANALRVLVTSSRMPFALGLVRKLAGGGREIYAADDHLLSPGEPLEVPGGPFRVSVAAQRHGGLSR